MKVGNLVSILVLATICGAIGLFFYGQYERQLEARRLRAEVARLTEEERHAKLLVLPATDAQVAAKEPLRVRWASTDSTGRGLPGSEVVEFQVDGEEVFIDTYQIIFDGDSVREGDPLRGRTLTLFCRAYGERQRPVDGHPLEVPTDVAKGRRAGSDAGFVPPSFRHPGSAADREFQTRMWRDFWHFATDPARARSEGVRSAQGTAVHKKVVPGKEYRITLNRQGQILFDGPYDPDPFVTPEK